MTTIYLHVGAPKTGTTALQYFLYDNRTVLEQHGICYPDFAFGFPGIPDNRNGHFLVHRVLDEHRHRVREKEKEIFDVGFRKLEELVGQYDQILLSEETLWNDREMQTKKYEKIRNACEKIGAKLQIIVYLRRQDLVLPSYWGQLVKSRLAMSFSEFLASGKYQQYRLDYAKHLQMLEDVVGRENIIVRPYEKQQYQGAQKSIFSDFLAIFGLELSEEFSIKIEARNQRLDKRSLDLKAVFNQNAAYHEKKSFLVELMGEMPKQERDGEEQYYDSRTQREFLSQYEAGNEQVARRYLGRKDGRLFCAPLPEGDYQETVYSDRELLLYCSELFVFQEQRCKKKDVQLPVIVEEKKGIKKILKKIKKRLAK